MERSAQWMSSSSSRTGVLAAEALEQRQQRLEQPPLRGAGVLLGAARAPGAGAELGEQRRQLGARGLVGQRAEHGVAVADERAQRGDERRVGQLALPQLHALAAQRPARRGPSRVRRASSVTRAGSCPRRTPPPRRRSRGGRRRRAEKAVSSSASSAARPIRRVLVTRVATPPIIAGGSVGIVTVWRSAEQLRSALGRPEARGGGTRAGSRSARAGCAGGSRAGAGRARRRPRSCPAPPGRRPRAWRGRRGRRRSGSQITPRISRSRRSRPSWSTSSRSSAACGRPRRR